MNNNYYSITKRQRALHRFCRRARNRANEIVCINSKNSTFLCMKNIETTRKKITGDKVVRVSDEPQNLLLESNSFALNSPSSLTLYARINLYICVPFAPSGFPYGCERVFVSKWGVRMDASTSFDRQIERGIKKNWKNRKKCAMIKRK